MRKSAVSILAIVTLALILGLATAHNSAQAGLVENANLTPFPLSLSENNFFATFRSGEKIGPNIKIRTLSDKRLPNNQASLAFVHLVKKSESIDSIILFYTGEVTLERYQQLVGLNRMLNSSHSWDGETIYAGRILLIPDSWIIIWSYAPRNIQSTMGSF